MELDPDDVFLYNLQDTSVHESRDSTGEPPRATLTAASRSKILSRMNSVRPKTGATTLRSAASQPGEHVTAILEGKGNDRLVGIAAFDISSSNIFCTQLNDSQTYSKTVWSLHNRLPSVILVPSAAYKHSLRDEEDDADMFGDQEPMTAHTAALLIDNLQIAFPDAPIHGIQRKYWSADEGFDYAERLCCEDSDRTAHLALLRANYYSLSALCALFKYLELKSLLSFLPGTLRIRFLSAEGTMLIDIDTVAALELVRNAHDPRSKQSLLGLLDHCATFVGKKLLKSTILAPLTDVETIQARLDAIAELVDDKYMPVRKALHLLASIDTDKLLGNLVNSRPYHVKRSALSSSQDAARATERKLVLILTLRKVLKAVPSIKAALLGFRSNKLALIRQILSDDRHRAIVERIEETINDDLKGNLAKGALARRNQHVYAIKSGAKALLEVARATYTENLQDAAELVKSIAQSSGLESLTYDYSISDGFRLVCDREEFERAARSKDLIVHSRKAKKVYLTTLETGKRNNRIAQSLEEVLLLSDEAADTLIADIRSDMAVLYRTNEAVALLDVLASFSKAASTYNYVRPEFTKTLAIRAGRNPLMERFQTEKDFVPNDTFANAASKFQIITGSNGSGKSCYLRQIALIAIMAQIGSFVPADFASTQIYDCLHARCINDDDLEQGLSHFAREMRSMSVILSSIKLARHSLLLVDELGRATSEEGVAITYAIAEEIIRNDTVCFFATHMKELALALGERANCVLLHLDTSVDLNSHQFRLVYNHRIKDGGVKLRHYGLELASAVGLPSQLIENAREITAKLDLAREQQVDVEQQKIRDRRKIFLQLREKLREVVTNSVLDRPALLAYVKTLQEETAQQILATL